MYTLVGTMKTRALRVAWMLEEIGADYDLINAPPRSEEARKHHRDGKVPVLRFDSVVLTDSVAIIQFLADRHNELTHRAGTITRAEQDSLTQFCVDEVEGALWTAAKNSFVLPEDKRVPSIKETCRFEFGLAMQRLETRLGNGPFIMGDMMTVPDILFGHCAGWAKSAKFEWPAGRVSEYFARLRGRPAFARALARSPD